MTIQGAGMFKFSINVPLGAHRMENAWEMYLAREEARKKYYLRL